jgi:hypothetical protein
VEGLFVRDEVKGGCCGCWGANSCVRDYARRCLHGGGGGGGGGVAVCGGGGGPRVSDNAAAAGSGAAAEWRGRGR